MSISATGQQVPNRRPLEDIQVPVRLKLLALWAAVMFLYVYVDIVGFYKPGTVENILAGRVWRFDITQSWALGALVLMTIPSLMGALSLTLPTTASRWINIVVASLYAPVSIGNVVDETWVAFFWFGAVVEVVLLMAIVRYAWAWPRQGVSQTVPMPEQVGGVQR